MRGVIVAPFAVAVWMIARLWRRLNEAEDTNRAYWYRYGPLTDHDD